MKHYKVNNRFFLAKITVVLIFQVLSLLAMFQEPIVLKMIGCILFGLVNAHSIQVLHQCAHYTGFSNRTLNDFVGRWLGLFSAIDFIFYRSEHFKHHKFLGTEKDTEFFGFDKLNSTPKLSVLFHYLFGLPKYISLFEALNSSDSYRRNAALRVFSFYFLSIVSLCLVGYSEVAIMIVISLFFITEPTHFFIEIPEHYGCVKVTNEKYQNTRTIENASFFAKWFTNWNNFHVEHHLYQWVLPEKLATFHNQEKSQLYNSKYNTYIEFYRYFFKDIFSRGFKNDCNV